MPTTAEPAQLAAINKQAILQNKSAKNHAKPTKIIHSYSRKSAIKGHEWRTSTKPASYAKYKNRQLQKTDTKKTPLKNTSKKLAPKNPPIPNPIRTQIQASKRAKAAKYGHTDPQALCEPINIPSKGFQKTLDQQ